MAKLLNVVYALPLFVVLGPLGCATETGGEAEGDVGTEDVSETTDPLSTPSCQLSRQAILDSTGGGRRRAIERAFRWYDQRVPYSQTSWHEGYRTDCSGYVSMCWETGTSYTTASFISGGGQSFPLGSYDALQPGDALVRRANGAGHMVLFLGWEPGGRSKACVLEQNGTRDDMEWGTRTVSSMKNSGYKPIRADKFQ